MIFSQVHSPRWKWDHLQTSGGKVEIETTALQTSGRKSTNTNLPYERTCISSEIFLKIWSFIWTFQCRLFRDSKSLREHLPFSALKLRTLSIFSSRANSPCWKRDQLQTSGGKSRNINLRYERTCMSSEIFWKVEALYEVFSVVYSETRNLLESTCNSVRSKWDHL